MKLKNKLKVYGNYLKTEEKEVKLETDVSPAVIEIPNLEQWKSFDTHPYYLDKQYCLIREKRYPIEQKRGKYSFSDFLKAIQAWQKVDISHPLSTRGYSPTDLFFFDTETTGLGGGVGNTIFLLGYAYLEEREVVVKQHLLPEPGSEIPLYESFLKSIDYTTLVTYNGKSFDWPQVKTRHTLIREHVPKLPAFGHFDLLHASRRLWKHKLESVKLSIVEKEILDIKREDDVPGYLAPMIYFDFVDTKNTEGIIKIMEHNEDDVLSLINLYTHISYQLLGLDQEQSKSEQLYVGKWYSSIKETEKAISIYENALENFDGQEKWKAMYDLSMQYKKQKQIQRSLPLWQEIIKDANGLVKIKASIEAAKFYEHQEVNIENAFNIVNNAMKDMMQMERNDTKLSVTLKNDVVKRMERLERKLSLFPR